ncbi:MULTISPECIES: hypothetical protein [unclassified Frankia]|uniref:hypothetical protein n=1 Tax=unclassified Frankia TaxID=2632575 RepID=UPI002AD579FF|nr:MULTISPECIES: hypothetical protein [unclassified Frankia]
MLLPQHWIHIVPKERPTTGAWIKVRAPPARRRVPHDPLKGPRPGVRCENCRTVWADGHGPDAQPGESPDLDPPGPIYGPS